MVVPGWAVPLLSAPPPAGLMSSRQPAGIDSALVQAATKYATGLGAGRVTIQSGRRAVSLYEGLGFASSPQLLQ